MLEATAHVQMVESPHLVLDCPRKTIEILVLWYPIVLHGAGIFRYIYPSHPQPNVPVARYSIHGAYCMGMISLLKQTTLEALLQTLFGCAVQYGWTWGPGKQPARQDDVGLLLRVSWMLRPSHPEVEATNKWKPRAPGNQ